MRKMFPGWLLALGCAAGELFVVSGSRVDAQTRGLTFAANLFQDRLASNATTAAVRLASHPKPIANAAVLGKKASLPVVFEPSADGAPAGAQFKSRARGLDVALTNQGISVVTSTPARLEIRLRGLQGFAWQGVEKIPGETNYFLGNDPAKWRVH